MTMPRLFGIGSEPLKLTLIVKFGRFPPFGLDGLLPFGLDGLLPFGSDCPPFMPIFTFIVGTNPFKLPETFKLLPAVGNNGLFCLI